MREHGNLRKNLKGLAFVLQGESEEVDFCWMDVVEAGLHLLFFYLEGSSFHLLLLLLFFIDLPWRLLYRYHRNF